MLACEYLARVGFAFLVQHVRVNADDGMREHMANPAVHRQIRDLLLSAKPTPHGRDGAQFLIPLTWPDRILGLKTWAGRQDLVKILRKLQSMLRSADGEDLFTVEMGAQGSSGIDARSSPSTLEIGFSLTATKTPIVQRPGLELLAAIGLETLPIISYSYRDVGVIHRGRVLRWRVESRDEGGYYHRWGNIYEDTELEARKPSWLRNQEPI